jgi:hypothetical protein
LLDRHCLLVSLAPIPLATQPLHLAGKPLNRRSEHAFAERVLQLDLLERKHTTPEPPHDVRIDRVALQGRQPEPKNENQPANSKKQREPDSH